MLKVWTELLHLRNWHFIPHSLTVSVTPRLLFISSSMMSVLYKKSECISTKKLDGMECLVQTDSSNL